MQGFKNIARAQLYDCFRWQGQRKTSNHKVDCAESKLLAITFIPRNQLYDWGFRVGSATRANHKVAYLHRFCTILRQRRRRSSSNPCRSRLAQIDFLRTLGTQQGSNHKVGCRRSRLAIFVHAGGTIGAPSRKLVIAIQGRLVRNFAHAGYAAGLQA